MRFRISLPRLPKGSRVLLCCGALLVSGAAGALLLYGFIGFLPAAAPALRVAQLEPALTMAQGDID